MRRCLLSELLPFPAAGVTPPRAQASMGLTPALMLVLLLWAPWARRCWARRCQW